MGRARAVSSAVTLGAAAFAAACAQNFYATASEWTHTDHAAIPTADIRRVHLSSRQGPIRVEAGPGDSIRVELRLGPARGAVGSTRVCDLGGEPPIILFDVAGSRLSLVTDRTIPTDCVAQWVVVQPPGLPVEVNVHAGSIVIAGLTGGVHLNTEAGDLTIRVAGGPVTAHANVGGVELDYEGDAYGAVSAETRVGSVDMFVNGREFSHTRAPGSGDAIRLDGGNPNAVRLTANVGSIAVRLGSSR